MLDKEDIAVYVYAERFETRPDRFVTLLDRLYTTADRFVTLLDRLYTTADRFVTLLDKEDIDVYVYADRFDTRPDSVLKSFEKLYVYADRFEI